MEELVSIIVPIYKVEKYLERCLNSIINQTYTNIEIILVDDGSPDSCGEICEKYKKIDSRIKVVHKQNEGLGMARNSGLEHIDGEYVAFVDSDDWVAQSYIEDMLLAITNNNSDFVISGYIEERTNGNIIKYNSPREKMENYGSNEIVEEVLLPILGSSPNYKNDIEIQMCVWTNLYKTSIIKENNLQFVNERHFLSEDLFFNIDYIMHCKKVSIISNCNYHYKVNEVSLTNSYRQDRFILLTNLYKREIEILKLYGIYEKASLRINRTFIMKARNAIRILVNSKNETFPKRYKALHSFLNNDVLIEIINTYPINMYSLSLRIPAVLMKKKYCFSLWIEQRIRYFIKLMREKHD